MSFGWWISNGVFFTKYWPAGGGRESQILPHSQNIHAYAIGWARAHWLIFTEDWLRLLEASVSSLITFERIIQNINRIFWTINPESWSAIIFRSGAPTQGCELLKKYRMSNLHAQKRQNSSSLAAHFFCRLPALPGLHLVSKMDGSNGICVAKKNDFDNLFRSKRER